MKLYVNVTKKVFAEKLRHPSSQNFPLSKISETSNGLPGELFLRNENFSKVFVIPQFIVQHHVLHPTSAQEQNFIGIPNQLPLEFSWKGVQKASYIFW